MHYVFGVIPLLLLQCRPSSIFTRCKFSFYFHIFSKLFMRFVCFMLVLLFSSFLFSLNLNRFFLPCTVLVHESLSVCVHILSLFLKCSSINSHFCFSIFLSLSHKVICMKMFCLFVSFFCSTSPKRILFDIIAEEGCSEKILCARLLEYPI